MDSEQQHIFDIKLKRLELNNFRPFNRLLVDFDENLTVFIGENGAGKSTIMDAVAYLFNLKTAYVLEGKVASDIFNYLPKQADVKNGTPASLCYVGLELTYPVYGEYEKDNIIEQSFEKNQTEEVRIGFDINQKTGKNSIINFQLLDNYKNKYTRTFIDGKDCYPILAYYGNKIIDIKESQNVNLRSYKSIEEQLYEEALNPSRFNFDAFYQWFDMLFKSNNPKLTLITETILGMLNDKDTSNYSNLRMKYDEHAVMGMDKLIADKPQWMEVNQMSSGEKTMIALIGDLCRRMILANPSLSNPLEGTGVVLIDEIDLHLHPKWQRKVVTKLREIFPNVQFVITTHSPVILTELYSKHIRVLDNGQIFGIRDSFGHSEEEMLEEMGGNSERKKQLKEIHRLLAQNKISEAKEKRAKIEVEGEFAPLLEIDLFIQRKEKAML